MSRRGTRALKKLTIAATALGLLLGGVLVTAPAASADTASTAIAALAASPPIYVGDTTAVISTATVTAELPSYARIAIVASGTTDTEALAVQIGRGLDPSGAQGLVVAVVSGHSFGAASSRYCSGYAQKEAQQAVDDHSAQLKAGGDHPDLTALITDFSGLIKSGPAAGSCTGSSAGSDVTAKSSSGSSTGWIWLLVILLVVIGGGGATIFYSRRRNQRRLADARAQIEPYLDRLAGEVNSIDPKDDPVARQAMADASERYTSAGAQLQRANTAARVLGVRQTVLQGLYAARTARAALKLDLGPPLPSITDETDQLNEQRPVTVQGQTYQGYPSYAPNAPYYYGGGYGVPGGWYGTPFWETLLLTSALGGGFGFGGFGGFGGGGYGSGYDNGFDSGFQAGENQGNGNDGGADWGSGNGGGGDWGSGGSGGGDWGGGGGGGGGGDWGGGGGGDGGANW